MTKPPIRGATPEDAAGCAAIISKWIDATPWMTRIYSETALAGMIADAMPEREMYVIGDPVIAYASFDPQSAKLSALYTAEQGKGLGKALIDKVRDGRDAIWLTTHEHNFKAQKFYRREGFTEGALRVAPPPEVVRELVMEWRR